MTFIGKTAQHLGLSVLASSAVLAHAAQPSPSDLVNALNGVFGKHAGARASHAKGICVQGHFNPNQEALQVTHGPLWQQQKIPVQGRFSVGGGNPQASDKGKTVRGLALRVGKDWDLVGLSAPVFMVATPEEFIGFMAARQPDPATGKQDPARIKAFNDATPSTKGQIAYLATTPVTASYASTDYFGVNAFVFTDAKGQKKHGRWQLVPGAGRKGLSDDELKTLDDHFLEPELKKRIAQAPVTFQLVLQLAQPGDDVKNPSIAWPASNPSIKMGEFVLTGIGDECTQAMFNPATLPNGISLSEDPTLLVRTGSYAVSLGRRLGN